MRPLSPLLSALVLLAIPWVSPATTHAAWPHDPNNGDLPICTAAGDQSSPTIASDGGSGAIITWADKRSGNADIYVQRVTAAGLPLWNAGGVALCTVPSEESGPIIVSDGAGGAIIVWVDTRLGTWDLFAQRVSAAGAPMWAPNGVALCTAAGDQSTQMIVTDGAGGAIVAWVDPRGTSFDVYAQRVTAAGAPAWTPNGVALCSAAGDQSTTTIASDGAGGAIVAWVDARGANWDIYAQRVSAVGAPVWAPNGVTLCSETGAQSSATIASDGAGGAIVAWVDARGADWDIYAQRVSAAGSPLWTANGVALSTDTGNQSGSILASDGAGGAIVAWVDARGGNWDIYAQRVSAAGAPVWPPNGMALCSVAGDQFGPTAISDGAGGAIVAWVDPRAGNWDIYAQRIGATGTAQWTSNGVALCLAVGGQSAPTAVAQEPGAAIVTWQDNRSGALDIYAQRVEPFGLLGSPEPVITSVRDIPNDQGGRVKLSWDASYLDTAPGPSLWGYDILRSVPPNLLQAALASGKRIVTSPAALHAGGTASYLVTQDGTTTYYWEYLTTLDPLHYVSGYSYVAPTECDSTGTSNPSTAFMVVATASTVYGWQYWPSAPATGYSVDNLAPATPAPLTGEYVAGSTNLHWNPNAEPDMGGYRLYRGSSAGFVPGPANLVAALTDTGFSVAGPAGDYFKLSAVDVHGNESGFALLTPASTTGVDANAVPAELAFAAPQPNPAREATLLSFALPHAGPVVLAVYDIGGRRVRTVGAGRLEAGQHRLPFDLRDDHGRRLPSGLYFTRLEAGGQTLVQRLAIME